MAELILNLDQELSLEELKERFESIAREYSLAVIEGTENGCKYPEASENARFLNDFIFAVSCAIEDKKPTIHN